MSILWPVWLLHWLGQMLLFWQTELELGLNLPWYHEVLSVRFRIPTTLPYIIDLQSY